MSKITKVLFVILLVFELAVQLYLAKTDSQTTDEGVHASAGYTYLTKGDFRFNPEHPPLVKLLSALPLLFIDLKTPEDSKYWNKSSDFYYDNWAENRSYAEEFFYKLGNNADLMLFLSRLGPIMLTIILAIVVFFIAKKYWGETAGLIAMVLYCSNPNVIAHGHLVTTDIAISLGFTLSFYGTVEYLAKRSWKNFLTLTIGLSIAFLSKFTAVILIPCVITAVLYYVVAHRKSMGANEIWRSIGGIFLSFACVMIVIFAIYGFDYKSAGDTTQFRQTISADPTVSRSLADTLDKIEGVRKVLIPKYFFKGLSLVIGHTQIGHSAYLMGMTSSTGWWYYFPIVFLAKNSIFFIALFAVSLIFIKKDAEKSKASILLLIFSFVYFLFAMESKANLGVRHILPFIVLICIFISKIFDDGLVRRKYWVVALVIAAITESVLAYPYFISYFNPLFGGRLNGYKIASDSNADWGQDVKRIKHYIDSNKSEFLSCKKIYVNYGWNGEAALDYYGVRREPIATLTKNAEGCIIIGASAYILEENSWLKNYPMERITPTAFFVRTQ